MILVIDDSREAAMVLSREIRHRGYEVETAHSGAAGLALMARRTPRLIFLDVRLGDMSGFDVLNQVRVSHPDVEVVMITGYPDLASAIAAIRGRVADYLCKPFAFRDLDAILDRIVPNLERPAPRTPRTPRPVTRKGGLETEILGESAAVEALRVLIHQLATSGVRAALVTGESGTGKELVARTLRAQSPRRDRPFVPVNCSAVGESLFESEFFGHERGAFTGAVGLRRGLIEIADGGILFLDEIGEMPRASQAKLLRFLDDQSFRRVGGERTSQADVQIIAATNRDLQAMVAAGDFRKDLYFRLNVAPIPVPTLRDRPEDIPILACHFLREVTARSGKVVRGFTLEAEAMLRTYPWPGNVRELRNLVERLAILCPGDEIAPSELPAEYVAAARASRRGSRSLAEDPGAARLAGHDAEPLGCLRDMERVYVLKVLSQVAGNKTKAAEILGISRQTLRTKLGPAA